MAFKFKRDKLNILLLFALISLGIFLPLWKYGVVDNLENKMLAKVDIEREYEGNINLLIREHPFANASDVSTWFFASGPAEFERHVYVTESDDDFVVVQQDVKNEWYWSETFSYLTLSPTPYTGINCTMWDNTTHVVKRDLNNPHNVESPLADRSRTGYSLLFPSHQSEGNDIENVFVDDVNITSKLDFTDAKELEGLTVYEYQGNVQKDCTDSLGVYVDVSVNFLLEPLSGLIVNFLEKTVTYFADPGYAIVVGEITFSEVSSSVEKGVEDVKSVRSKIRLIEFWVPVLTVITMVFAFAFLLYRCSGSRLSEGYIPST